MRTAPAGPTPPSSPLWASLELDHAVSSQLRGRTWSAGPSMPTPRRSLQAVRGPDGRIYAIGGRDADNAASAVVESLDPVTGAWRTEPSLKTARSWFGAAGSTEGRILVVGGLGDTDLLTEVESFTPGDTAWQAAAPLPASRGWLSAVGLLDDTVLALGGALNGPLSPTPPPTASAIRYKTWIDQWSP